VTHWRRKNSRAGRLRGAPGLDIDVSGTPIRCELLDGRRAVEHEGELRDLHREVYGAEPAKLRTWFRQPGFVLAEARHGDYLVGYATGMPLRPSTSWWKDITTSLPEQVTTERPGRTFALTELMVRAAWRRQGIAWDLHDLIIDGRQEERATLTVPPTAAPAQKAFLTWGWHKVARTRVADVFVKEF
jgi:ribosomal protein S18 acetylase RimI-like enzyme